jgi:signal transduction histidine kinase
MLDPAEQRILIHAPFVRDAALTAEVLGAAGLACQVCADMGELMRELARGAGAVLAVEEALGPDDAAPLTAFIARQPAWSDLPVVVFTKPGGKSTWIDGAYERLGNLTLIERPVRTSSLVSAARSALRARLWQYEICRADQRKDEFLAMLGHELRNPLAPIGAAAELLALAAADPAKVRQASEIVSRQVRHMTSLIDDLLDVARVTRGLIKLDKAPVDLRHILAEAMEQVAPSICARRHKVALHFSPDPAPVHGDRKRLVQVVANVLSNAAKYTPEAGNISARIDVQGERVVLEIADDGIGMAPEVVERVFELFAQAERTSDRAQGGLGLGLSLVHSLVESHGGQVRARSAGLGRGSTFTIVLPRMSGRALPDLVADAQEAVAAAEPAARRVLIVDDNADAATMLQLLLETAGHEVAVELTAAAALAQAQRTPPQVCLLDIGLPDVDGNALARRLRAMPETAGATLIAVTGYGQEQDRANTRAAGFDHHFVKPVDAGQLLDLLARV